ncbi:hypothetical protein NDU88_001468 [Pleurodeles waltl]|uniref:Uncharacterized protein n=1 Tax=Pleurodeles waltl TaxID=8319 RepID=A0AAV7KPM3_PLEWA|nr:hypothetical protein NDU88_001468 [Pleurodeles waltl]
MELLLRDRGGCLLLFTDPPAARRDPVFLFRFPHLLGSHKATCKCGWSQPLVEPLSSGPLPLPVCCWPSVRPRADEQLGGGARGSRKEGEEARLKRLIREILLEMGEDGRQKVIPAMWLFLSHQGQSRRAQALRSRRGVARSQEDFNALFYAEAVSLTDIQEDLLDSISVDSFVASLVGRTSLDEDLVLKDPVDKKVDVSVKNLHLEEHRALRAGIYKDSV